MSERRKTTLGEFVSLQRGHDLTDPERKAGSVPVMGSAGQNGFHDTALAKGPGVVIGRSGASFGQIHFSPRDYWPHNTCLYVTDFHGNDAQFAYYFLKSIDFGGYNSGSAQPSLNRNFIYPIEIEVPEIDEQRAIAHILGALDDKIELNRRMNETLEAMARAIFRSWFVDFDPARAKASGEPPESICRRLGLTPDVLALFPYSVQDSELGEIPKGWAVRSFGELCDRIAMGPFGSNIKTSNFVPQGVPVIRGGNLTNGFIDDRFVFLTEEKADQLRNSNARPGNIVITHRGTLGQVGLIPSDSCYPRYVVSQSQMVLSVRSEFASSRYLYEFLRSPIGQQALLANTSQVGVPAIAQPTTSVKAIRVVAPPVDILRAYDLATKSLFDHASATGKQANTLSSLRDLLLPKLISGDLAIPILEAAA